MTKEQRKERNVLIKKCDKIANNKDLKRSLRLEAEELSVQLLLGTPNGRLYRELKASIEA